MKSTVFVRPNLKAFILSGILLVVVQHLITNVHSQSQRLPKIMLANAREVTESDLQELVRHAGKFPSVEINMRISRCYESRGDYRKALFFLRLAEKVAQTDGSD